MPLVWGHACIVVKNNDEINNFKWFVMIELTVLFITSHAGPVYNGKSTTTYLGRSPWFGLCSLAKTISCTFPHAPLWRPQIGQKFLLLIATIAPLNKSADGGGLLFCPKCVDSALPRVTPQFCGFNMATGLVGDESIANFLMLWALRLLLV